LAIVSISRIQIRRGRKNLGSGLPQLAGGELGWAVDTQELFIGNGAVSEGAPAVGNSKILTEHDNLFELSDQYTYRNGSNVQTGATSATPIVRSLQSRLDDNVSVKSFGATGDGTTDDTASLQRAVDQLFLPWSSSVDADNYKKRIILKIPAGLYKISESIKLPPYVNIVGDGSGKTVVKQTGAFPVFETVNGEGIQVQTSSLNQANKIRLEGLTLESFNTDPGLVLSSCKESKFADLHIKGPWVQLQGAVITPTQVGILLEATSTPVTSKDNTFEKITITGFSYAVLSNKDVLNNTFNNMLIESCGYGVVFGRDTVLGQVAQNTGPINNTISNSRFSDININGVWIRKGIGNISSNNSFSKVGNDAGLDTVPVHSVIKFEIQGSQNNTPYSGNISSRDYFSRTALMIRNFTGNVPYIAEIEGPFKGELSFATKFNIGQLQTYTPFIKLPADTSKTINIDYQYKMSLDSGMRKGTLQIIIDKNSNTSHITDSYDHQGTNADLLNFTTQLTDQNADANFETLVVQAINPAPVQALESANVILHIQSIA